MWDWFARRYDDFMEKGEEEHFGPWRRSLLQTHAAGSILEIGAGSGASIGMYPPSVTRLVLLEPSSIMRDALASKLSSHPSDGPPAFPVDHELVPAGIDGKNSLAFADDTFDVVVSSLALCGVPRLTESLREARRVLKPGGKLVFMEHVAPDGWVAWMCAVAIAPVWRAVLCCSNVRCIHRRIEEVFGKEAVEYRSHCITFLMKVVEGHAVAVEGKAKTK